MHDFHASDRTAGRLKGLEAEHRTCEPFHCSMILLHDVIEIFRVADKDGRLMSLAVVCDRCGVAATLIDRNFLRQPLAVNRGSGLKQLIELNHPC